jgi:hypothetical protein
LQQRDWITLAGVVLTAAFSTWSAISACRARRAEKQASQRADAALEAAQDATAAQKQIAAEVKGLGQIEADRQEQESRDRAAVEAHPFVLEPIPGEDNCYLRNGGPSVKYGIEISGFKIPRAEVGVLGPGQRARIDVRRFGHPDNGATVTWYVEQDLSDSQQSQPVVIPSRIG